MTAAAGHDMSLNTKEYTQARVFLNPRAAIRGGHFWGYIMGAMGLGGCHAEPIDLRDDPISYIESASYRKGIVKRDLREQSSSYARDRFHYYGSDFAMWDRLPEWDPPSRPLYTEDHAQFVAGTPPVDLGEAHSLVPAHMPESQEEWIALGKKVFFSYPIREDQVATSLVTLEGGLEATGFIVQDDAFVGLRLFENSEGGVSVATTCAQCHGGLDPDGVVTGVVANKNMDIGAARLLVQGLTPGDLPAETETTDIVDLDRLGPGRADVQNDGLFNPFAFPDLGGIVDMPLLHHNANWTHSGVATMAVRCETLFITASRSQHRIPRVLAWALAEYYYSLPAPAPVLSVEDAGSDYAVGAQIFETQGCSGCHVPPLYSSDQPIAVAQIGTDPLATQNGVRGSGWYRIPSLRGVGRTAPYLHHGVVPSLDEFFHPDRPLEIPGHEFGLNLSIEERHALITFLKTL